MLKNIFPLLARFDYQDTFPSSEALLNRKVLFSVILI